MGAIPARPGPIHSCSRAFLPGSGMDGPKKTSWPLRRFPLESSLENSPVRKGPHPSSRHPRCSDRKCSQKSGCSGVLPSRVLSRVLFLFSTQRAPSRALSEALPRAPRFLRALSRAPGEHFRRCPCSQLPALRTQPSLVTGISLDNPAKTES